VLDSGPGIPKDLAVFRLFETTKRDGSGLGLAIARQIVSAHGGTIRFGTVRPHGTIVHVDLPLDGKVPTAPAARFGW
jgi:signal transduction histidine kinase